MGKTFNKGLDKDDKKEGLFKRLKNIEDKNEKQSKLLSNANKTSSYIKNENDDCMFLSCHVRVSE